MPSSLDLYHVDQAYISYLQQEEIKARGFTRVPFLSYPSRKQKFACGIILESPANGLSYFVTLSSYSKQKSENILIQVPQDKQSVKGSLRFNYMFPVPMELATVKDINKEPDQKYRDLLLKELQYIRAHEPAIRAKAEEVYKKITSGQCSSNLLFNSCDFRLLEQACIDYCESNGLCLPSAPRVVDNDGAEAK